MKHDKAKLCVYKSSLSNLGLGTYMVDQTLLSGIAKFSKLEGQAYVVNRQRSNEPTKAPKTFISSILALLTQMADKYWGGALSPLCPSGYTTDNTGAYMKRSVPKQLRNHFFKIEFLVKIHSSSP